MLIKIDGIKINPGRREAAPENVQRLSESIAEVGMMNPITVAADYTLIAGLHRLEAAKRLGWAEIECRISDMDALHTELAEINENVIRTGLSDLELSELLARRKKIYEMLHPATIARNLPGHASNYKSSSDKLTGEEKPFSQDTTEKMGVSPRTVERHRSNRRKSDAGDKENPAWYGYENHKAEFDEALPLGAGTADGGRKTVDGGYDQVR